MKKRILTGDRPTGPLHLGHYIGTIINRVKLQYEYETFIIIADAQALTTNFEHPEILKEDVFQVAIDNLACGVDQEVSSIFIQSMIPEIAELTIYYSMLVSVSLLFHNPTIKSEAKQYHYEKSMPYGFLGYPVSQTADITFCKANLVPVGEDQLPHIELARKIVRKFNQLYGEVLVEPEPLLSHIPRLPGLDGGTKMSKSLGNCIYLGDAPEEVEKKIKKAVTDPQRIRATDPGHPEICPVFLYHKAFNENGYLQIQNECQKGKIGCVACKEKLTDILNKFLKPIREKRKYYKTRRDEVREILYEGTKKVKKIAEETMKEVRAAIKIDYFK